MGQCNSREETLTAVRNTSARWYENAAAFTSSQYNAASEYMSPQISRAQ